MPRRLPRVRGWAAADAEASSRTPVLPQTPRAGCHVGAATGSPTVGVRTSSPAPRPRSPTYGRRCRGSRSPATVARCRAPTLGRHPTTGRKDKPARSLPAVLECDMPEARRWRHWRRHQRRSRASKGTALFFPTLPATLVFSIDAQLVPHRRDPPVLRVSRRSRSVFDSRTRPGIPIPQRSSPRRHPYQGRRLSVRQSAIESRPTPRMQAWGNTLHTGGADALTGPTELPPHGAAGTTQGFPPGNVRDSERPGSLHLPGLSAPARQRRSTARRNRRYDPC